MTNNQRLRNLFAEYGKMNNATNDSEKEAGLKNILSMMSDDIEWTTCGPSDIIPFAGVHKGKSGVTNMFMTEAEVLQQTKSDLPKYIGADDDEVQVFYVPLESVKLQGKPDCGYTTPFAMIFTFNEDGLITNVVSLSDSYAIASAFQS